MSTAIRDIARKSLGYLIPIVIVVAVFGLLAWIGGKQPNPNALAALAVPVSAEDWSKGSPDAKLTIVEYSDLQCPACRSFYPVVQQLLENYGNDIRVVYRHFPLTSLHANAEIAAKAAEAAGKQGKFWEMHDVLFETQAMWSGQSNAKEIFVTYAESLSLNIDQFRTDVESADVEKAIEDDTAGGSASNIGGTPTFFINGKQIDTPRGYEPFAALIEAKLAELGVDRTASAPENDTTADAATPPDDATAAETE